MVAALGANQPKQTPAGKMPWLLGDCLPTNQLRVVQLPSFLQPERPLECVNNGVRAAGESIMVIAFVSARCPSAPMPRALPATRTSLAPRAQMAFDLDTSDGRPWLALEPLAVLKECP